jgi:hypothetical protein
VTEKGVCVSMVGIIRNVVFVTGICYILYFSWGLPTWTERIVLGGSGILVFTVIAVVFTERIRRFTQGFYVKLSGGADDGDLTYNESGRILRLYFKRRIRIIYVPSDPKWLEVMPTWARENKSSIMPKIRGQIGKHWNFEETEKQEYILQQG